MPTLHREHGLSFVVFTDDHPPPHVHVTGRCQAKVALEPDVAILYGRGLTKADTGRILDVVRHRRTMMLDAWKQLHD